MKRPHPPRTGSGVPSDFSVVITGGGRRRLAGPGELAGLAAQLAGANAILAAEPPGIHDRARARRAVVLITSQLAHFGDVLRLYDAKLTDRGLHASGALCARAAELVTHAFDLARAKMPAPALPAGPAELAKLNDWPCHSLPKAQWCDHAGPGGFMGHTCAPPSWLPPAQRAGAEAAARKHMRAGGVPRQVGKSRKARATTPRRSKKSGRR